MRHRRHAAATVAGVGQVPCIVRPGLDDKAQAEIRLVENLHRQDLSPLEEAEAYHALIGMGYSQRELAKRIGRSQPHISRRLSLFKLPETARAALLNGAEYIVAPTLNLDVIRLCRRYDKLVFPGAFTPTEILTAWEAGADVVKVFPADVVGPEFFRALRGPLPQVRLMPTGGVGLSNAEAFIKAGACCVGVGSELADPKLINAGQFDQIRELAVKYREIVQKARPKA